MGLASIAMLRDPYASVPWPQASLRWGWQRKSFDISQVPYQFHGKGLVGALSATIGALSVTI
jgi:hypothetical protein